MVDPGRAEDDYRGLSAAFTRTGDHAGRIFPNFLSRRKRTMKKAYVAPTVTVHGNAVVKTQGYGGKLLELINWRAR